MASGWFAKRGVSRRTVSVWTASVMVACAGMARGQDQPAQEPPAKDEPLAPVPAEKQPAESNPGSPMGTAPVAPPAESEPAPDSSEDPELARGRALFRQASEALARAQALTFHVKFGGEGDMLGKYTPKVQADVRMMRDPSGAGWIVRATGQGKPRAEANEIRFDIAWFSGGAAGASAATTEWVDHETKKVFEKRPRDAKGTPATIGASAKLDALIKPSPFSKEMTAESYAFEERARVGGVECDIVNVTFAGRPGKTGTPGAKARHRYAFGVTDHLPRKIEQIMEGLVAGSLTHEIDTLRVDEANPPAMTLESLRVEVPEGYAEDRVPPVAITPAPATTADGGSTIATSVAPVETSAAPGTVHGGSASAVPGTSVPVITQPKPVRSAAPKFDLAKAGGGNVSLESFAGKVVVLSFFGTWCLPCRDANDELRTMMEGLKDAPVALVAMSVREKSAEAAEEEIKRAKLDAAIALNADAVARQLGVRHYPSVVVLGTAGEVIGVFGPWEKATTIDAIKKAIDGALPQAASNSETPVHETSKPGP